MKPHFKNWLMLVAIVLPLPAQAGAALLERTLNNVLYLQAEDTHRTSKVSSGQFKALNGDTYQLSHFYRSHRPQFNAKLAFRLYETKRLRLSLPLHADNGFKADLYEARPYAGAGLSALWRKTDRLIIGFHLQDALKIGGDVTEMPCHDGFRRAFHCGTGLPWRDARPYLRQSNVATYGTLNLRWQF